MAQNDRNAPVINLRDASAAQPKFGNWIAKGVCLLIAFFIWLYVMQVDNPGHQETYYSVTVSLTNTSVLEGARGLSVYSGYGNTVDVTVVGQQSVLSKLTAEDIRVTADLSSVTEAGSSEVPVKVELPSGVSLISVSQNTIPVYCDEKSSKVVGVRARISQFMMASHLEMGELVPEYDTVVVIGPKEALNEIEHAQITLELGAVSASMTASGKLFLVDHSGNRIDNPYLKLSRSEITVQIPVYTTKTLPLTVDYKYGYFNSDTVRVALTPSALTVRGDPAVIDRLTDLVVATIDEKKIAGDTTQLVPLYLEDGITAADGTENVLMTITHVGTSTMTFRVIDIDVTGAVGISYEILDTSLSVTVRGTLEQLGRLRSTDFSAVIDLSGYTADSSGVIREPAVIRIDSVYADGVYEVGEYSVQVKLN